MDEKEFKGMSYAELLELAKKKKEEERDAALIRRDAYEGIRAGVNYNIEQKVLKAVGEVKELFDFVMGETSAFYNVMKEYGQLRNGDAQTSFVIPGETFKIEVKSNKVKKFDERADVAAQRLIEFLQGYIKQSEKGSDDPMYQLAMMLLGRNKYGDLDYKSISKLYELEGRFNDDEYTSIMNLFRESNVTEGTATNFYFWKKNNRGVWLKLEPSFNRL
jgi:hypothetical protein